MVSLKYDAILKRELKNSERMNDAMATINFMYRALDALKFKVAHVADDLTDAQLERIEEAVTVAYNAVKNAEFLGDIEPLDVYPVRWCEKNK